LRISKNGGGHTISIETNDNCNGSSDGGDGGNDHGFYAERKHVLVNGGKSACMDWIDNENECKVPNNLALSLFIMATFFLLTT
jgi:hypothetical protein